MIDHLKVIKTKADYEMALKRFESLLNARPGQPEYDERDVLAVLIERYEDEKFPIDMPDPVQAIKFRMEQAGLSQKDLVPVIGSRSKVSEILSGKRRLTLAMIRSLHKHFGIPADVLLREPQEPLPKGLSDIDFSRFPLREMEKKGAFRGFEIGKRKIDDLGEEAIRWLVGRIGGFSAVPQFALRKNDGSRLNAKLDTYALLGWSLQVLAAVSENGIVEQFDPDLLTDRFVATLVAFSVLEDGPRHVPDYLKNAGISMIALPLYEHTYLDGAVFLRRDKTPVIALTLRYDRLDNFWFVLLHELGHLKLGHLSTATPWIADDLDLDDSSSKSEREADAFARRALLPDSFDLDKSQRVSSAELIEYSRAHGVHPAIVAGRIQHARKDFRTFWKLVGRGEVRKHFFRSPV
jgi:HTH-type transcriptional regulator/antitoxin HigA